MPRRSLLKKKGYKKFNIRQDLTKYTQLARQKLSKSAKSFSTKQILKSLHNQKTRQKKKSSKKYHNLIGHNLAQSAAHNKILKDAFQDSQYVPPQDPFQQPLYASQGKTPREPATETVFEILRHLAPTEPAWWAHPKKKRGRQQQHDPFQPPVFDPVEAARWQSTYDLPSTRHEIRGAQWLPLYDLPGSGRKRKQRKT